MKGWESPRRSQPPGSLWIRSSARSLRSRLSRTCPRERRKKTLRKSCGLKSATPEAVDRRSSMKSSAMNWKGVMPAITTCFNADFSIDHGFVAEHCRWLLDHGCAGIVALGSLGEGATLSFDEKVEILRTCTQAIRGRAPVVASISSLTTSEAVALAKAASDLGCDGLMVLPPYVYQGDWREMKTHVAAVF